MKRDQTTYTCDGCRRASVGELNTAPAGWHLVLTGDLKTLSPAGQEPRYDLCSACYAGVDWILRFQGRIVPPKVIAEPRPMARHNAPCDVEPILQTNDVPNIYDGPITVDTLPPEDYWIDPMKRTTKDNALTRITGTLRGTWPRLGVLGLRPGTHDSVTVVDLVETADGHLVRPGRIEYVHNGQPPTEHTQ